MSLQPARGVKGLQGLVVKMVKDSGDINDSKHGSQPKEAGMKLDQSEEIRKTLKVKKRLLGINNQDKEEETNRRRRKRKKCTRLSHWRLLLYTC